MLGRAALILATMLLGVIVLSGVALALTISCTTRPMRGTAWTGRTGAICDSAIARLATLAA